MKPLHIALALAFLVANTGLQAKETPTTPAAPPARSAKPPPQPPDVAAPKLEKGQPQPIFMIMHSNFVRAAQQGNVKDAGQLKAGLEGDPRWAGIEGTIGLLFLGDSITQDWIHHRPIWEKAFGAYKPAEFGVGGDKTQHLLWRLENGELDGIKPRAVVLLIGTNNESDTPEGIAAGVKKIVTTLRTKLPAAKVLVLGIFPRGEKPGKVRVKIAKANELLAQLDNRQTIFFMDIGDRFLNPDGTLQRELTKDFLHLSSAGYQVWADAISPKVAELMK